MPELEQEGNAQTDKGSVETNPVIQEEIKLLADVRKRLEVQAELGNKLMESEDFKTFMALKNAGKKIEVKEAPEADATPDPIAELLKESSEAGEEGGDAGDLTKKELVELVAQVSQATVEKAVEIQMGPLTEQIKGLADGFKDKTQQEANVALGDEISAIAAENSDFESYSEDMEKLHAELLQRGRLSVKDMYLLAKIKKHGLPSEADLESERPTNYLGVSQESLGLKRDAPKSRGRGGFQQSLRNVLAKRFS